MVNMKMDAKEAKEWAQPTAADAPEYPYGLCISLCDEDLAKLGITALPTVGAGMVLTAKVVVTSVSAYQTQGNEGEASVSLQITDMDLTVPKDQPGQKLYDSIAKSMGKGD